MTTVPGPPTPPESDTSDEVAPAGAWAPLRHSVFRALWLASMFSNVGTWMQTVGAQMLLVDEPRASTLVASVQTASTLPVVLLALPSGVLADSFDRRRLLLAVQFYMAGVGVLLAVLTAMGEMRPPLLLLLTFAIGVGTALVAPTYQALIPELVPRPLVPSAAALGSVSMNVARAVGPAIAGLVIARAGVAAVFAVNAASFAVFAVVLLLWRRGPAASDSEPERFRSALRAGGRYVRHSPVVRRLLLRATLFLVPAMALWALLPLVATRQLETGAGGYGILLGALGVGAVAGVMVLPRLRAALSTNRLLLLASILFAVATAVVGTVQVASLVVAALLPAGAAWVAVLSTMNAQLQVFLPGWVRARGLAIYQMTFFGGQALGAFAWGLVGEWLGLEVTFVASAALMALSGATVLLWPLREVRGEGRDSATYWDQPQLTLDPEPGSGPILVQLAYSVVPEDETAFLRAMDAVRRSRQSTGAYRWQIYRDGETPGRFVEAYLVPTWDEHLRQHEGRLTWDDAAAERDAMAWCQGPPEVHHYFPARPR